jgi:acyl-CoA thioesterase I
MNATDLVRARRVVLLGAVLVGALLAVVPRGSSEEPAARERASDCYAPASALVANGAQLRHTDELLLSGAPVTIIAFGSSSTAGAGASSQANSYPAQLAREIKRRYPLSDVTVLNKGINGEQSTQMMARLQRDVLDLHPDLVIWQTGSNEILKHGDIEVFKRQTTEGLAKLKAAGIEVILMDAQYTPRIIKNTAYPDFNGALRAIASEAHVPLFDRFKAMQFWLATERRDWSDMVAHDLLHLNDHGYRCVASEVASLIVTDQPTIATR